MTDKVYAVAAYGDFGEGFHVKAVYTTNDLATEAAKVWWRSEDANYYSFQTIELDVDPSIETLPETYNFNED